MREDAAAGLTLNQCALKRKLNPRTVKKYAKIDGITFRRGKIGTVEERRDEAWSKAWDNRHREIQAAKTEAATAPLYRRWPDGV